MTFYADLRVPFHPAAEERCFAGRSGWDGQGYCWAHQLDLEGPDAPWTDDVARLVWEKGALVERGLFPIAGKVVRYEEVWANLPGNDSPEVSGLVPVGAQHGPHLPTGTERTGAPVLPAIPVACSYVHGTVLPGTLSLSPSLPAALGSPAAPVTDHLRLSRPDLPSGRADWWTVDPEVAPDLVHTVRGAGANTRPAVRSGRPSEANLELGARLLELTVAALADRARRGAWRKLHSHRSPFPPSALRRTGMGTIHPIDPDPWDDYHREVSDWERSKYLPAL